MAEKKSPKKQRATSEKRDYVAVLLEDMRDDIKAVAEQHGDLNKKIDGLDKRIGHLDIGLNKRIDNLDIGLNKRIDNFRDDFETFKIGTDKNFKAVFKYLSRIEDELIEVKREINLASRTA